MNYQIDLYEVCYALSDALDLVGVKVVQHGKRVAYMALECGKVYGLNEEQQTTLFLASVLHDCGVSSTEVHWQIISKLEWEGEQDHCLVGHDLLGTFAPFQHMAEIILLHHTPWLALNRKQASEETKLFANLIHLVDRIDALIHQHRDRDVLLARRDIVQALQEMRGVNFAPQLVDAFVEAARPESFWLTLEPKHLERYLHEQLRKTKRELIDFDQLKTIARIFARVVDAKSRFTAEHSTGVSQLARFLAERWGLPYRDCELIEIAGLLHDLGKLRVPDEILDKPARLDEVEFATVERHTFETYQILKRISTFDEVAVWASFHHENLSGQGYPFRRKAEEIPIQARIVAVADVFQALAQDRPYRASLPVPQITEILDKMVASGKLDAAVVKLAQEHAERCFEIAIHPAAAIPAQVVVK
ncbi:MAG: HD domain-containing phosphohydrolase [Pseudomonadota bacterium]